MHQPTPTHPPHDTSPPPPASDMKHGRVKELTSNQFVIGTRKSELAMWQTRFVQGELEQRARETFAALERVSNQQLLDKNMNNNNSNNNYNINYNNNNNNSNNSNNSSLFINNETVKDSFATFSLLPMTTTGDDNLVQALAAIGSKALFTKELELALESHQADFVVHSLKDMPTTLPPGMVIAAMLKRANPYDALVLSRKQQNRDLVNPASTSSSPSTLSGLQKGSVVGTSSVRRIAQIRRRFPHLVFLDVRGNLNTRIAKLDAPDSPFDALVLAYAGLYRLGWSDRISSVLGPDVLLHAVGQGALAIECRENDDRVLNLVSSLDHLETRLCCEAERAFMRRLEGGCSVPLGVSTRMMLAEDYYTNHGSGGERNVKNNDSIEYILELVGCVCSVDGIEEIKEMTTGLIHFPKSKAPPPYTSAKSSSQQTSPTPPPPPPPSELYIDITGTDKELYHSLISSAQDVGTRLGNTLIEKGARRILDAIRPNSFK